MPAITERTRAIVQWVVSHPDQMFTCHEVADSITAEGIETTPQQVSEWCTRRINNQLDGVEDNFGIKGLDYVRTYTYIYRPGMEVLNKKRRHVNRPSKNAKPTNLPSGTLFEKVGDIGGRTIIKCEQGQIFVAVPLTEYKEQ